MMNKQHAETTNRRDIIHLKCDTHLKKKHAKFEMFNYLLTKWQTNTGTPNVSLPVYFPF